MSGQERCEPEDLLEREWEEHHPAVFGVAYRILGTVVDAEDVVQDVWLRASGAPIGEVRDLRAWLITVAARRAYDIARSARIRRETYVGPWLPEPLLTGPDAAERVLVDDALTTAMLLVLEELSPPERVAFVLQQAFEVPYARIAQVLGRSEPACRQLVSRARAKVRAARAEHTGPSASGAENASRAEKESVLAAFRAAAECGDLAGMVALLAPDATYTTDGGGALPAARKVIVGAERIATVLLRVAGRWGPVVRTPAEINGEPGMLGYRGGEPFLAETFEVTGGRITAIRRVLNPRKLSQLPVLPRLPDDPP